MKLSDYMKNQMKYVRDDFMLEAAGKKASARSGVVFVGDGGFMATVKKISSVAACLVLAVAAVITFTLIRNSVENVGDTPGTIISNDENDVKISYDSREEYGYIMGDRQYLVYNDYVIDATYKTGRDVHYYSTNDLSLGGLSVFTGSSVSNEGVKSLGFEDNARVQQILIEPYETERNNGVPILYMVVENGEMVNGVMENYSLLIKYNMRTNETEYISDHHFPKAITTFGIFGDTVFMTADNSELGHEIYAVNINTGEYKVNDSSLLGDVEVVTADGEYLYYYNYNSEDMGIYRCAHDLEDSEKIADSRTSAGIFIYDGYIYHYGTDVYYGEDGNVKTAYMDYRKTSLTNKNETEILFDGIKDVYYANGKIYWKKADLTDYNGTVIASEPVIYVTDMTTGEDKVFVDYSDRTGEFVDIYYAYKNKMLLQFQCFAVGEAMYQELKTCTLDLDSGELTEIVINKY